MSKGRHVYRFRRQPIDVFRLTCPKTTSVKAWNSEWGNKDFATKRDEGYSQSKLWVQTDLQAYDHWSTENIENREEEIAEFALEKWSMPQP
jgi:hypothetical protein